MFKEANVKQVVNVVISDIKLFQLRKGLNALYFFQFTTSEVENLNIFERGSDVAEASDNRII